MGIRRCTYCYKAGHNRRTCPTLTANLQASADAGCNYSRARLESRGKGSGAKRSERVCGFCNRRGHDRRKCPSLHNYVNYRAHHVAQARRRLRDRMEYLGFGPGTLLEFETYGYVLNDDTGEYEWNDKIRILGLVTDVKMGRIGPETLTGGVNGEESHGEHVVVSYVDPRRDLYGSSGPVKSGFLRFPKCVSDIMAATNPDDGTKIPAREILATDYNRNSPTQPRILSIGGKAKKMPDSDFSFDTIVKEVKQEAKDQVQWSVVIPTVEQLKDVGIDPYPEP